MALEHDLLDGLRTSAAKRMATIGQHRDDVIAAHNKALAEAEAELAEAVARYEALCRIEVVDYASVGA